MKSQEYVEGECYLVVRPVKKYGSYVLTVNRVLKSKPALDSDEVAMKIGLKLPMALFIKPTLSANINVEGEVPQMEVPTETVNTIQDLIRSQTGLDVELRLLSDSD